MNYMDGLYRFGKTVRSVQKKTMVNVAMIAALFGGGGHANASGFTSASQSFTNFLSHRRTTMTASIVSGTGPKGRRCTHLQHIYPDLEEDCHDFDAMDKETILAITEMESNEWPVGEVLNELLKTGIVTQEEINEHTVLNYV